jgi:hypothetical protein
MALTRSSESAVVVFLFAISPMSQARARTKLHAFEALLVELALVERAKRATSATNVREAARKEARAAQHDDKKEILAQRAPDHLEKFLHVLFHLPKQDDGAAMSTRAAVQAATACAHARG